MFRRLFPNINQQQDYGPLRSVTNEDIPINYNLALSRGSFFYRAAKLYNALPIAIKRCATIPTFKKHLKQWVKNNVDVTP